MGLITSAGKLVTFGSYLLRTAPEEPPVLPDGDTYYVSAASASTDWAAAMNIATPCTVATAFANAQAGDTVRFRGGLYSVPAKTTGDSYTGYYSPANSGAVGNPITFMAQPGETPVFDGRAEGGVVFGTNGAIGERIFGVTGDRHYIVFDGFTIQCDGGASMGSMVLWGGSLTPGYRVTNVTIKNCTFNGGTATGDWHDNSEGLRMERVDDILVQRCTFHNYRSAATVPYNVSATKTYNVTGIAIEHCEVYNCSGGLYDKSSSVGDIYRYNFIHDCTHGIYATAATSLASAINGQVYGNLILRCSVTSLHTEDSYSRPASLTGWEFHHNTCYQDAPCTGGMSDLGYVGLVKYHSNIMAGAGTGGYGQARFRGTVAECDYNCYDDGSLKLVKEFSGYYTLPNWQALTFVNGTDRPDLHSLTSDPVFANVSGTLTTIADFALVGPSPCVGAGKAGTDMGCDVSKVGVNGAS